ncbi:hypothetical protein [Nocardia sp. R6R-6]|uniref:hypothetical protein n=1 Tax=Nocardia sp. R6R-6 TaxID=3459303 RepID=UPI00403E2904
MPDVGEFLMRWNRPGATRVAARLRVSRYGNINTVGLPGIHEADDLDPAHPDWVAGLETGVRPLVVLLTSDPWQLITYDSCQGHFYDADTAPEPALRQVGVLPRDAAEHGAAAAALCRALTAAEASMPQQVRLALHESLLSCGRTGSAHRVLDMSLDRAPGVAWDGYFSAIDEATEVLVAALAQQRPTPQLPCACASERA